jgi:hypothetical protein
MRDFIGENINIDGRMIPYQLVTASDYFNAKDYSETEMDEFFDNEVGEIVNQIMGLKQSCYLLRHTSHSCQSLSDNLYSLKLRLIHELKDIHNFEFDDDFVESYR